LRKKLFGSPYRSGRSPHWVKVKNPKAPAVKREVEEDWGANPGYRTRCATKAPMWRSNDWRKRISGPPWALPELEG